MNTFIETFGGDRAKAAAALARFKWDSETMQATNAPEADAMIRKTYRKSFELPA